jgi:hypothetical protein
MWQHCTALSVNSLQVQISADVVFLFPVYNKNKKQKTKKKKLKFITERMLIKILQSQPPPRYIINEFCPASETEMKPSTERRERWGCE